MKRKLVRICGWCGKPLNKQSARLLARHTKEQLEASHGICKPCIKKFENLLQTVILVLIPYALLSAL